MLWVWTEFVEEMGGWIITFLLQALLIFSEIKTTSTEKLLIQMPMNVPELASLPMNMLFWMAIRSNACFYADEDTKKTFCL